MAPSPVSRAVRLSALFGLLLTLQGCELVMGFIGKTPEERLAEMLKTEWASPGGQFVGGEYGSDTIESVEAAGTRTWRVTIPDQGALEGSRRWELELEELEVYSLVPGEAFAQFLNERAQELNRRIFLPQDAWRLLTRGDVLALGSVRARVQRTDQTGSARLERVAYLRPAAGDESRWTLEPQTLETQQFRDVVKLVYDELILRDERVLTCMEAVDPSQVPRTEQLQCVGEVLEQEFGE